MKTKLKKGQTVMIYHDPLTVNDPEGEAKLVRSIWSSTKYERWMVRFKGNTGLYDRLISI